MLIAFWAGAEGQYGPVRNGDTVYRIAQPFRDQSQGVSLHHWAWAIYVANPRAFPGDLGSLQVGSTLHIPSEDQVRKAWRIGQGGSREDLARQNLTAALEDVLRRPAQSRAEPVSASRAAVVPAPGAPAVSLSVAGPELVEPLGPEFAWFVPAPAARPGIVVPDPVAADDSTELADTSVDDALDVGEGAVGAFRGTPLFEEIQSARLVDASAALAQLRLREDEFAGDVDFDYLYGVLLLDFGSPQEAIYPLLRAYQQQPTDLGIRLDLGRAYFDSGENETARLIFRQLADSDPPPRAAAVIDSYLRASEASAGRYEGRWHASAALNIGHDSNANSASGLAEFSGFLLDESAQTSSSGFAQMLASAALVVPLGPRLKWQAGLGAYSRNYDAAAEFDTQQWSINSGLGWKQGDWMVSGDVNLGQAFVDGDANHDFAAVNARWRWFRGPRFNWQANLKYGVLRYASDFSTRDVDQVLGSVGAAWRYSWLYGVETGIELAVGSDSAVDAASPYGRDLLGGSLNVDVQTLPWLRVILSGNYLASDYSGPFLGLARDDRQRFVDLEMLFTHNRWRGWSLRLGARAIRNASTVDIYGYDRNEFAVGLKWQSE